MKIPYFCCIGAELKRYQKDFDFMNQVYLYKIPYEDTIEEVLSEDYFKAVADTVLQDDIVYVYESAEKKLHICKFELSAGHITAIRLATDVISVNGKTGEVVLTGEDILADVNEETDTIQKHLQILHDSIKDIELFKFPNATIVGEPTINHGQVSGFSVNNYLQFPTILDLHNKPFVIDFCFTTGNDVTTQQNILDSQFGIALAIANGRGLMAISHNGTSWAGSVVGTMNIQPNTTYYARLSWNRMNYQTQLSTDGTTYVADMNFGSTQSPYPRTIFIGGSSSSEIGHTPHPFGGSINLNYAYLTVDGQIVWQGMDDAGLATRMDIDAGNISNAGKERIKEIARNGNISNCITEIPQDIKLELSGGILTLKAGSKAYLPVGTTYSATQDVVLDNSQFGTSTNTWVLAMTTNNTIFPRQIANCVSGAGATTVAGYAYDTTTNVISWYNTGGNVGGTNVSFPIAIFHTTNGVPDRIDQVFNGFGYIGSTVFALPGVKGLIPNGRNADGSLKNTEYVCNSVVARTFATTDNYTYGPYGFDGAAWSRLGVGSYSYNKQENRNYNGTVTWGHQFLGYFTLTAGVVSNFTPKTAFHALDYNDTEYIAHQAMPSNKYIDLTLGSASYIAPADGYYTISQATTAAGQFLRIQNATNGLNTSVMSGATGTLRICMPVSKGDSVIIGTSAGGSVDIFRFIYANGSK